MGKNLYLVNHSKEIIHDLGASYSFNGCNLTDKFFKFDWKIEDSIEIIDDQCKMFDDIYGDYTHIDDKGNTYEVEND